MLPSLAPFESAQQGHKRAVSQTLNPRKASRPQISFTIFEKRGYRETGFRASPVCGNSLGIDPHESTRRADPDVRVTVPDHCKDPDVTERVWNSRGGHFRAVPPHHPTVCPDPQLSVFKGK